MSDSYSTLPQGARSIEPFTVSIPESDIQEFRTLLKYSKIAAPSYENTQEDRRYGVSASWLANAKEHWLHRFDWRAAEAHMNSFPHFTSSIEDDGDIFQVHFVALFSAKPEAIPLLCLHGWPGSFLEFLPMLSLAKEQYTPSSLPYHLIVPSLPGFAFSSGLPTHRSMTTRDSARILDRLMDNLTFSRRGYVTTGGDIGSMIARLLGAKYPSCKGVHLNFCPFRNPPEEILTSAEDRAFAARTQQFLLTGSAYAMEHGTRTSTIGLVLNSNPLALLAWIGEKFLSWSDIDPSLDTILEDVSLYWFTGTIARCLFSYRQHYEGNTAGHQDPSLHIKGKPFGYSLFSKELMPSPKAWVETTGELTFFRQHDAGGHFAALEKPREMWADLEEFVGSLGDL